MQATEPYEIVAFNTASASENRIHDDAVARKFGFQGGLVPGVDVYAYMTRAGVLAFGREFLERGWMSCRFDRPVYDGETVTVEFAPTEGGALAVVVRGGEGEAASGEIRMPEAPPPAPEMATIHTAPLPQPEQRPAASEGSLPEGRILGTILESVARTTHDQYLKDVRETHPIYAEHGLVHPGFLLRRANSALKDNVRLGPWIHVGSEIQHYAALPVGRVLETRSRVVRRYDHKGHGFVALDVLLGDGEGRTIAAIRHTAIYEPRQVRQG